MMSFPHKFSNVASVKICLIMTFSLQSGQWFTLSEHDLQVHKWPQGKKTTFTFASRQLQHFPSSFISLSVLTFLSEDTVSNFFFKMFSYSLFMLRHFGYFILMCYLNTTISFSFPNSFHAYANSCNSECEGRCGVALHFSMLVS